MQAISQAPSPALHPLLKATKGTCRLSCTASGRHRATLHRYRHYRKQQRLQQKQQQKQKQKQKR